jgi:hypothetical protein
MKLRRMPADGTGKSGFCQPGGVLEALADTREELILQVAMEDVRRAMALDGSATKAELLRAIGFLAQSCKAAVEVAELRGERLETLD